MSVRKIIVAVTGASGAVYALKLLERLRGLAESLPGQGEHSRGQVKPLSGHSMNTHAQAETIPGQTEQPRELPEPPAEVAVIFTGNAEEIMLYETGAWYKPSGTETIWDNNDFNAPFASGSSSYDTMIICPASMGMVGRIAHGVSDDLITRAADVMLKERRRLILVPRETPYSLIHITNMKLLTEAGAVICPATPSFYSRPQTIDQLVMTVIDRVLTLAGFTVDTFRWNEEG
jgi:4-hydroxy-3-polyprenylbenzoate decarboxylase